MFPIRLSFFIILLFTITSCQARQAAGLKEFQSLKGKVYSKDKLPSVLEKYQLTESSQVSPIDDTEQFTVYVYQLKSDYLVFFTLMETDSSEIIQDVLPIKGVKQGEWIKTVLCREGTVNNAELVAVVRPGEEQHSKALRVWRFSRDKRKFVAHTANNVSCLNEGYER